MNLKVNKRVLAILAVTLILVLSAGMVMADNGDEAGSMFHATCMKIEIKIRSPAVIVIVLPEVKCVAAEIRRSQKMIADF